MLNTIKCKKQLQKPSALTPDELRKYKGLEGITEVEAERIALALQSFSLMTYQLFEIKK